MQAQWQQAGGGRAGHRTLSLPLAWPSTTRMSASASSTAAAACRSIAAGSPAAPMLCRATSCKWRGRQAGPVRHSMQRSGGCASALRPSHFMQQLQLQRPPRACSSLGSFSASLIRPPVSTSRNSRLPQKPRVYSLHWGGVDVSAGRRQGGQGRGAGAKRAARRSQRQRAATAGYLSRVTPG